eukprot:4395610-Pleurochrysis_carterae.AAC.1
MLDGKRLLSPASKLPAQSVTRTQWQADSRVRAVNAGYSAVRRSGGANSNHTDFTPVVTCSASEAASSCSGGSKGVSHGLDAHDKAYLYRIAPFSLAVAPAGEGDGRSGGGSGGDRAGGMDKDVGAGFGGGHDDAGLAASLACGGADDPMEQTLRKWSNVHESSPQVRSPAPGCADADACAEILAAIVLCALCAPLESTNSPSVRSRAALVAAL